VPNTYAEWRLFVPPTLRLSNFGGSMSVAEGTTYGLLDAWGKFLAFYGEVLRAAGNEILLIGFLAFLVIAFVISAVQRGWSGVLTLLGVMTILAVLAGMLLPVLSAAKRRAQRINSVSELKQIGLATRIYAGDNTNCLPVSLDAMKDELGSTQLMYDVFSGQPFVYLGAGMSLDSLSPDSVLAYSPPVNGVCNVLFADGSVSEESPSGFQELSQRGLVLLVTPNQAPQEQSALIQRQAMNAQPVVEAPPPVAGGGAYFVGQSKLGYEGHLSPPPASAVNGILPQATTMSVVSGNNSASAPTALGANMAMLPPPVAAGVRSIHIELPQTGQPFLFTKVLNIGDEPLSIHARVMPLMAYQVLQMAWQTAAFLIGLVVWWVQWRRANRNTFILTVALVMIIGSVCSLLVQWRALHDALIVGFPLAVLAIIALLIWKYWPRRRQVEAGPAGSSPAPEPPPIVGNIPPVVAAALVLFGLSLTGARAADFSAEPGSIISANYSGTVNSRVAAVDATLEFAPGQSDWIVPLFGSEVAVQQFTVKCGKAELVRDGDNLAVRLEGRGRTTLEIKMLVKTRGDVTKRELAFNIPSALSSQMTFVLNESEADVDFPTAVSFKRILEKNSTRVEAVMGSADQVDLLWTPRVKQAGEVAATVFCQNATLVTFGGGVVDVHATMDYQITQGELHEARVQLPAGQRLLRVEGEGIRTWEIKNENGAPVLVVDLLEGMSSAWRLTVETEKNLDALPASVAIDAPHVLDVKRETGFVALRGSDELALSVETASGLERVGAQEFPNTDAGSLLSVFQFSKPEFALRARVETIQPEIEAVAVNNFQVGPEQISLSARIDYTIKRAGIFGLELALPDGYRVENVEGNNIEQQNEQDNHGSRTLDLVLKDRTSGAYSLNIELACDFKELPKSLAIAGVQPVGMARLTGYIAVSAEPGVAVKMKSFDGLMEIPSVSLPEDSNAAGSGNVLAYKFIASGPESTWNLSVTTESVPPWVRAEIVNTISLTETLANGRALVRYDIANAPVKELRVRVPENFQNVEITGPNIRSREQDGNVWRVELQSPVQGTCLLTVTWEQPFSLKAGATEFDGVSAEGVERETGLLAITAKAPMQASEAGAEGLQRVDTGDFPDWAGNPNPSTALAYRYVRPGYKLSLNVRQLDDAEVLQAIVEDAQLTSIVADDGQMMTELTMSLQSNGRQFLEIALPPGATVWSAFVAGQPVQPGLRDGKLLLPIEQSGAGDGATSIELTYVGTNAFPGAKGQVGFVSPQFDVPLKNARWEVYLPPDYDYKDFKGTMTHETAPAPELASTSFSSLDYSLMEKNSRSADKAGALEDLTEARRQLENGDARAANAKLSLARKKLSAGELDDAGVQDLESDLQNAQASNLIAGQNDFTARNSMQNEGEITSGQASQSGLQYDNAAAQEQWSKLQQAQEIVSGKIQPLHVNLPVRGRHFTFTQVLQTETGEPMTIQLFAANTKAINWSIRILSVAGVFLLLWVMVAVTSHLTLRREVFSRHS
jgi:prepilin-type processing-associated H-X9-DG protein